MTKIDSDHSIQIDGDIEFTRHLFFFKMKSLMPWIMQTAVTVGGDCSMNE